VKPSLLYRLRTVLVVIPVVVVLTVLAGTITIAASLFDHTGRFAHAVARWWARGILVASGVKVRVTGLEALVPGATYVFVANHQSMYDIPVVFWSLPYQLRTIAKESLGRIPFLGWHLRRTGHLLVDRSNPDRDAILSRWRELVGAGLSLVVFPEGTRSPDGRVRRFKAGSFMLALQAGLPLVPLSIAGTGAVLPKGNLVVVPQDVTLVVHPPIQPVRRSGPPAIDDAKALAAEVQELVSANVVALERERGSWTAV
jgi:1-acyl-sn-glycerol-3-phosphate acyltransferase